MRTAKAMEDRCPVFEIPVQYSTKQEQKNITDLVSAQKQDNAAEEVQMSPSMVHRKRQAVPIHEKALLTLEEAAEYTGIGLHKLRELSSDKSCTFILWNGNKRMFKRKKLEEYLVDAYSI